MRAAGSPKWLWWLFALCFSLLAFDLAMNHDVEEAGVDALHAVPRPEIRRVIPLGALEIAIGIRRHLPVVGSPAAWLARKVVSVAFFGVAGWFGLMLVRKGREPLRRRHVIAAIAAGTALSALIEWAQAPESAADVALDLGCGVAGGLLAAALAGRFWGRAAARSTRQRF